MMRISGVHSRLAFMLAFAVNASWVRADPERDDQIWIIPRAELGNMHDVVSVIGGQIRMNFWPEDLVIVPR